MNGVPRPEDVGALTPGPANVTFPRRRVFADDGVKVGEDEPPAGMPVSLRTEESGRRHRHAQRQNDMKAQGGDGQGAFEATRSQESGPGQILPAASEGRSPANALSGASGLQTGRQNIPVV